MLVLAELLQSCPNFCDPVDHSPPASSVYGILQASMECVAISYFKGSSGPRDQINISYLLYRQAGSLPLAPPGIKSSQIYWANSAQVYVWLTFWLKHLTTMQKTQVRSLGREDPLEKEMATHSVFLPEEFHGGRSLVGYSPRGCKELDTTELLHSLTHSTQPCA